MKGKAIIAACRVKIGAEGIAQKIPAAKIRDAIHAKTGVLMPRDYLHNLHYDDHSVSEEKRTVFAQFLEIDPAEIALPTKPLAVRSKRGVSRHDTERKDLDNERAQAFIRGRVTSLGLELQRNGHVD